MLCSELMCSSNDTTLLSKADRSRPENERQSKEAFNELSHGIMSYFGYRKKSPLNRRKPGNNSLQRQKNTKEMIINHRGTRRVKDGED